MTRFNCSRIVAAAVVIATAFSCISVNQELGKNYLATDQQYRIYTSSFPIHSIEMGVPDSLSTYSLYRFSFGAVRDAKYGLTKRSAAFTLVPVSDSLDFGTPGTQVFKKFRLSAVYDSTSFDNADQEHILQNINVYELLDTIRLHSAYPAIRRGSRRITDGIPVYNGMDSLAFNFSREFGEKYMTIAKEDMDTITNYTKRFPGIVIETDDPAGIGGRINMFKLPINVSDGYIQGSYATLSFSADYGTRKQVDTSFIFYLGPLNIYKMGGVTSTDVSTYPQIAFNMSTHETDMLKGAATDEIFVEGGRGLKPVIKAEALKNQLIEEIKNKIREDEDIDVEESELDELVKMVTISKASLILPFEFPDDYLRMRVYPTILSPTLRSTSKENDSVTYAGLSDSNLSSYENQGNINRSLCQYAPDVTHHIQELISPKNEIDNYANYDIWLLPMRGEVISTSSSSSSNSDLSDYYTSMAYASYYNQMYGGYGGYGGYGYGGYGGGYYSNYYNMMMLASMYSSSSSTTVSTQEMLDYHRYYQCSLNGPESPSGRVPTFKVVYMLPKKLK